MFHSEVAHRKSTLDGYNVIAYQQNPFGVNEWDSYL